jgi:hypothetical protein
MTVPRAHLKSAEMIQKVSDATAYIRVRAGQSESSGSGFVVPASGDQVLVATNDHVVNPDHGHPRAMDNPRSRRDAPVITVVFRSGVGPGVEQSRAGTVIAADGEGNHDLALIRVRGVEKPPGPVRLSATSLPEVTTPVLTLGFPFGNIDRMVNPGARENPSVKVNRSSISGTLKDRFGQVSHVQINGGIDSGNSGGPVVDERTGEVVGIAVAKISNSSVGFAIPAAELSRMLDGRLGSIRFAMRRERRGLADPEVEATLFDPLKQVRSAELLYTTAGATPPGAGPSADGSWPTLPGATSVTLELNQETASAAFQAPLTAPTGRRLMVQAVSHLASGRLVCTAPMPSEVPPKPTVLGPVSAEPRATESVGSFESLGPLIDPLKQPAKDCELKRNGAILTIQVPAGVRLLSPELGAKSSPMTLIGVEGDFIAQVEVSGNMVPGTEPPRWN